MDTTDVPGIVKTPGVCSGRARIDGTRLAVDFLVRSRRLGNTDADLLSDRCYPYLTREQLSACWEYFRRHPNEIEREIWLARAAEYGPGDTPPPAVILAGLKLGIAEDEVRQAFDTPLTDDQLGDAWVVYRANPRDIDQSIAALAIVG